MIINEFGIKINNLNDDQKINIKTKLKIIELRQVYDKVGKKKQSILFKQQMEQKLKWYGNNNMGLYMNEREIQQQQYKKMIQKLKQKRQNFRYQIRKKENNELFNQLRQQLQVLNITSYSASRQCIFRECGQNNEQAFKYLGNLLISQDVLFKQAVKQMKKYNRCENYSWVVLILIKKISEQPQYIVYRNQFLTVINHFIDQEDLQIKKNGIKCMILLLSTIEIQIINIPNYMIVIKQLVFSSNQAIQFLAIHLLIRSFQYQNLQYYLFQNNIISILNDLLYSSNLLEDKILSLVINILTNSIHRNYILTHIQLRNLLIYKVYVSKMSIKQRLLQMWRSIVQFLNSFELIQLYKDGLITMFMEGMKLQMSFSNQICSQGICIMLQKLQDMTLDFNFETVLKQLQQIKFPQKIANIYYEGREENKNLLKIIDRYFNGYMISE